MRTLPQLLLACTSTAILVVVGYEGLLPCSRAGNCDCVGGAVLLRACQVDVSTVPD
jgi:hypothetical protein